LIIEQSQGLVLLAIVAFNSLLQVLLSLTMISQEEEKASQGKRGFYDERRVLEIVG
jgi:hypothetical protein